jgi:hypothetical protein
LQSGEFNQPLWLDTKEPLTDTEKALLDARLAAYEKDPDAGSSWAEVEARIRFCLAERGYEGSRGLQPTGRERRNPASRSDA